MYDKRLIYLDYLEAGEKKKTAGFVKLIWQGRQCRIQVNISGLYETDTGKFELHVLQEENAVVLDRLYMEKGKCLYYRVFMMEELQQLGIFWERLQGIRIHLSRQRLIQAMWQAMPEAEPTGQKPETRKEPETRLEVAEQKPEPEIRPKAAGQEPETRLEAEAAEQKPETRPEMAEKVPARKVQEVIGQLPKAGDRMQICDDKWEQLSRIYPVIHPFGDDKEYLSVAPRDFVVLTREYQPLANNSFLLHGFYNYHHVILGKIEGQGQERIYLGVPGVYHEREKVVAVMFGFDSFECAREPAETGTFGYYMKQVEI